MIRKLMIAIILVATGVFAAGPAIAQTAADLLIGINDRGHPHDGSPNELVQLDLTTGVATRVHIFAGFNDLESLCYDARDDVLWSTNDGTLVRIDPHTFVAQPIGNTGLSDINGVSIQPGTGILFGITFGSNDLITINKQTGHATLINGHVEEGSRLEDLAFDASGHLYVITSNSLVELSPADGTRISKVSLSGAPSLESLVWWNTGSTFLTAGDRGTTKDLMRLDPASGAATFFSPAQSSGCADVDALAFLQSGPPMAIEPRTWGATKALYR